MYEAARVDDTICHSSALMGFLVGALIGIALIVAVSFIACTAGLGGFLVGLALGYLANVAAHDALGLGEAIGSAHTSPAGKIVQGSPDVFINDRHAAVVTSPILCDKHGMGKIAQGSSNVDINVHPAARKDDKTTCGGAIGSGSDNVFIGGGTTTYLDIEPEIPKSYRYATEGAFLAAGLFRGLASLAKAGMNGGIRALGRCGAGFAAGMIAGEVVNRYGIEPLVGALVGHPVEATSGRKLLLNSDETDFILPGPLPLSSSRFYASNLNHIGMLGRGWMHEWDVFVYITDDHVIYTGRQGREIAFPKVDPGQKLFAPAEKITLAHLADGRYMICTQDEIYYIFGNVLPDGTARLMRIEDQVGRGIGFQRDETGRLECVASQGQVLRLSYTQENSNSVTHIELVEGGKPGPLVMYNYDSQNRLIRVTDRAWKTVRRFSYVDDTTLMRQHRNALDFVCEYRWETIDGQPRVVEHRTSEGECYRFGYDTANRRSWVQDTFERQAQWHYDEYEQVVEAVWFDGQTSRFDYDASGNLVALHLPGNRHVTLEYDDQSRLVKHVDPLGRVTRNEYDGSSVRLTRRILPDGTLWQARYEDDGLLLWEIDPLGRQTRYDYFHNGLPDTIHDARGGTKVLKWISHLGLLSSYTDCSGKTTHYEYNKDGDLCAIVDAEGKRTTIERNRDGAPTKVTRPDDSQEQFEYESNGLLRRYLDPAGKKQDWLYNGRGQVLRATDPAARTTAYRYDEQGRLLEITNGNGNGMQFEYDAAHRLTLEIGFDKVEKRYRYDAAGFLIGIETQGQDEAHKTVTRDTLFKRDAAGQLLERHTDTAVTTYEYDLLDRLLRATRTPTAAGQALGIVADTVAFEYDKAGQLIAEEGAHGRLTYALDELGNLTTLTLPQGQKMETLRYGSGHVHQLRIADQLVCDIERDDLHREILRTQGRLTTAFGFDALGRRSWQSTNPALGGSAPATPPPGQGQIWRTYDYDRSGELTGLNDHLRGMQHYSYDEGGWLLSRAQRDGTDHFTWDKAGNLSRRDPAQGYWHDTAVTGNRLKVWQDVRLAYDAFGNIIHKKKGRWREQQFAYDADNRLLCVRGDAPQGGPLTTRFAYDALGRRIGKTVLDDNEVDASGQAKQVETRFVWQGMRMVQEQCQRTVASYVYEPGSYAPLARLDQVLRDDGSVGKGQLYYFHVDQIGTPQEVTDEAGKLHWAGRYTAWGKLLRNDLNAVDAEGLFEQNVRYQGQYADESTGLHYNTFRYYDPDIGRFVTQDPIGLDGGINLYRYAPNPVSWVDPWGWEGYKAESPYHGFKPSYENPGHHDPTNPDFRGGGSRTTPLPPDAEEVYRRAVPADTEGKTWYGQNSEGEFYRYQDNNQGKAHWNGRENSSRGLKVPNWIKKRFNAMKEKFGGCA